MLVINNYPIVFMFDEKLYKVWKKLYEDAKANMRDVKDKSGTLIEVAAQHPLLDGERPNEEFEKRLQLAIDIYRQELMENKKVKIYVPGSIHMDNGIVDKCSLSEAGKKYLVDNGVNPNDIYADNMNIKYKGDKGVYNSTDECFVASNIFGDERFKHLHCVCSSGQMMRKMLSYIRFGYVPYMHTVSCDNMYHDYIDEIFKYIPILLEDQDALQGESKEADRLRKLRKPNESL